MDLLEIVSRKPPRPWIDGEKIPWDEAGFSQRMLAEHLSQQHDAASRRFTIIDQHVEWIHRHVLCERPARILDLGCGPGFYLSRLARLGHSGVGIDFSPASIAYARGEGERAALPIHYWHADLRSAVFDAEGGAGFDLAMLLFGEFNTFRPADAQAILDKAYAALRPGGRLLLEPSTFGSVQAMGEPPSTWYAAPAGLWCDHPHLCLQDNAWDANQHAAVERYTIIEAESGAITQHAMTTHAYGEEELGGRLAACGFATVSYFPSLLGRADADHINFYAVVAHKPD
jgi:SAM-dependent methyltransferase